MLNATITLKLTKDHEVIKNNVTPLEAMLLTAEFHKLVGGCPFEVHKDTVKEIVEGQDDKGKPRTRSDNEEIQRLRGKYHPKKIQVVTSAVRELPKTFEEAVNLGVGLMMPESRLSETNLK